MIIREDKIVCVVVTYNRKKLLNRCLDAINVQTLKPKMVVIIDNASTDGTMDSVQERGFYNCVNNEIEYKYVRNHQNIGGAGGFYTGIKMAYESGAEAVWVMDDDGQPDKDCLMNLVSYSDQHDYLAPIVLSDEDHKSCSFALHYEDIDTFSKLMNAHDGIIENWASPFNGILYSRRLVDKVGYPKREMFIWGDEANYHARCIKAGYIPCTILKAVHYHPLNRVDYVESVGWNISVTTADWKLYCCIRNIIYNELHLKSYFPKNIYRVMRYYIAYISYYPHKHRLIHDAFFSGLTGNFSRLSKYMK